MSKYPLWWNQTITVYNKYINPTTKLISWYRHEIPNCFWKCTGDKVTIGETVLDTDITVCRVPKSSIYMDKYRWNTLTDGNKLKYFTFNVGDIIVKGKVTDTINEYTSNQRSSDLISKYSNLQGCMLVQRCAINTGVGRGLEHYYIKGI